MTDRLRNVCCVCWLLIVLYANALTLILQLASSQYGNDGGNFGVVGVGFPTVNNAGGS